ncbi:MAG: TIGR03943 family protein [Clostridia bacterium]|nr:TIGR03943 family protein [Clostridia bacterium]MDY6185337.1 TIGR03943 family protein [Eubacteriales bacterium]
MEMPVYLFTGFLEAGKTTIIEESLADKSFNCGERWLVILCEEGEVELDLSKMAHGESKVTVATFDEEQKITADRLSALQKRAKAERVIIEYNGMWNIQTLYDNLPEGWFVNEELCLIDATTAMAYNANMRQLMFDKLQSPAMVIFNRMEKDADQMPFHKLVRAVNRRAGIGYEYKDGSFVPDTIEDPLPYDLNAPVVKIPDRDYAVWYSHMSENMDQYDGKTVRFLGVIARSNDMDTKTMAVGRQIMTCCAADIAYRPLIARYPKAASCVNGSWVTVTGKLKVEPSPYYDGPGPVLYVTSVTPASEPENPVATYY